MIKNTLQLVLAIPMTGSVLGFVYETVEQCPPDLIVTAIEPNGTPSVNADGSAEVPLKVTVMNIGGDPAGAFKVSTHYTNPNGMTYVVSFKVGSAVWYPSLPSLAAGASHTFTGNVIFNSSVHNVTVPLWATVDRCSGDEFMPAYCRVEEERENNNDSAPINVAIP